MDAEVEALNADPAPIARLTIEDAVEHYEKIIYELARPPIIMGHSFGGTFTQILLDRGLGAAGVGIASATVKGVRDLSLSTIKATSPALNPFKKGQAVPLTAKEFHYAFANTMSRADSDAVYQRYHVPASTTVLREGAFADFHRDPPTKVDFHRQRAPLLFIAFTEDHIVPPKASRHNEEKYDDSTSITPRTTPPATTNQRENHSEETHRECGDHCAERSVRPAERQSHPVGNKETAMPAVTVNDILTLPRIPAVDSATAIERPVRSVTTAPSGLEGEGFSVRRAFAGVSMRELDPFVHMDQMGEVDYAPGEPKGTPWHPHRGFETVTYIIDGIFDHQDSNGGGGRITNGDTQWMTAGAGILHIEAPPEQLVVSGGLFHGIQLWVNLPAASKWNPPRYQDIRGQEASLLSSPDGGALVRVIDGQIAGYASPGSTFTPITMIHATVSPGATLELPWPADFNALGYVLAGRGDVGPEHRPIHTGQLAVFGPGNTIRIAADATQDGHHPNLEVLILGGRPIGEPVVHYGPFVMNTKQEIAQAIADYQAGRLGQIPAQSLPHHHADDVTMPYLDAGPRGREGGSDH